MSKAATLYTLTGADALAARQDLGLNQTRFWRPIGVTQSGGSRYESGRKLPQSIQALLLLAYGTEDEAAEVLAAIRAEKVTA